MWNPQTMELMPGFWPPRPSRFWNVVLSPLRRYYLHHFYGITDVKIVGAENLEKLPPRDGALIAPNHSHDSDPHVMMEVGHRLGRQLYFMAAWQVFLAHHGIDGWVMQRFGAFSGLALQDELKKRDGEPWCGVCIVDLRSGDLVEWIRLNGAIKELFDVAVIPVVRCPMALGVHSPDIQSLISFEPDFGPLVPQQG